MNRRILDQYKGELTSGEISEGMNAAKRNAARLIEDANFLMEAKRFPSACSLAILAIEEAGKVNILRGMSTAKDGKSLKKSWRHYRHHRAKNVTWILGDLVRKGAKTLFDLAPMFDEASEHPEVLDTLKQLGFYTDCFRKGHWSEPECVIDEEMARSIMLVAEVMARPRKEISAREIELWVDIVGPHIETELAPKKLLEWHEAMLREGLTDIPQDTAQRFIFGDTTESSTKH